MQVRLKRIAPAALVVACATLSPACRSKRAELAETGAAPNASVPRTADRLAPGELAEGKANAFGLVLPREMSIERRFPDAVHVSGHVAPEAVANYVRQRVETGHVEIGAARSVFPTVHIKGADPGRVHRIEVIADGPITRLIVRDVTPVPMPPGLSEEERWRRAGFSADGKPLNREEQQ